MTRSYVVAKGAAADLEEIARYTAEQWGEEQCRVYIGQLDKAAEAVAKGEGVFKDMSSLHPKLRMALCGRHYVFCLPRPDAPAVILAILHEHMDIIVRLRRRLG